MTLQIDTTSPKNTLNLAAKIGSRIKGGEVIELVSDLGGGKTVFVRGLAKGMGSTDQVSSPTFTISREYKAIKSTPESTGEGANKEEASSGQNGTAKYRDGATVDDDVVDVFRDRSVTGSARKQSDSSSILWLHHFDFYRLADTGPGVVADELSESIKKSDVAVAIEWSGAVEDILPKDRLRVEIIKTGDDTRKLELVTGKKHQHLLKD